MNQTREKCSAVLAWGASLCVICLGVAGCGGSGGKPTAHLQGTVTLAGKPLPAEANAQISFVGTSKEQAPPATAQIVAGKYDCPTAPQGAVKVQFNILQPSGPEYTTERGDKARQMENLVSDKYAAGIDLQVTGDNAEQNFDL
jgi:hypothetical protein